MHSVCFTSNWSSNLCKLLHGIDILRHFMCVLCRLCSRGGISSTLHSHRFTEVCPFPSAAITDGYRQPVLFLISSKSNILLTFYVMLFTPGRVESDLTLTRIFVRLCRGRPPIDLNSLYFCVNNCAVKKCKQEGRDASAVESAKAQITASYN